MRNVFVLLFLILSFESSARMIPAKDIDPWRAHFGLMAGMNVSQLAATGPYIPLQTSTVQWTADFGIYFKSTVKNMFRFEVQSGLETVGGGREFYMERADEEFVRIYDRYKTIPLTALLLRSIGWKETIAVGLGFKSSFITNFKTRHAGQTPDSGIIFSPQSMKWVGSPVLQLSYNFPYAEIALSGWYAVTPLIDQFDVKASPYGATFMVKARLFNLRR